MWLLTAQFEIQQLNLKASPQVLANAIGKAPKDKVTEIIHLIPELTTDKTFLDNSLNYFFFERNLQFH
jgi:hypothetical protein